jgi:LysR family glycine cleavage system transcriptional activator
MKQHLRHMNALRAFEAAGRLGRMTLAADELHVTPGAISRQVRQLEDALGVALFEGPKNRPTLTAAGKQLQPALSAAFMQVEQAVDAMLERQARHAGRLLPQHLHDALAHSAALRLSCAPAWHRRAAQGHGPERGNAVSRSDVAITVWRTPKDTLPSDVFLFDELLGPVLAPALARGCGSGSWRRPISRTGGIATRTRAMPGRCGAHRSAPPCRRCPARSSSTTTSRWRPPSAGWASASRPGTW